MLQLENYISSLPSLSLQEAMAVDLNARFDLKALLPVSHATLLLQAVNNDFLIQKLGDKAVQPYRNIYYDTSDLSFYKSHGLGKTRRLKIRKRFYADTETCFIEIKHKEVLKTVKKRKPSDFREELSVSDLDFIGAEWKEGENLSPSLYIDYDRLVIWKNDLSGRITVDFNYRPFFGSAARCFNQSVILEMKGSHQFLNWALRAFSFPLSRQITSFSKYCIGLEETRRDTGQGFRYFLPVHKKISKINN